MSNKKPHRNGPCPCGSGKKYKKCCMEKDQMARYDQTAAAAIAAAVQEEPSQPQPKNSFRDEIAKAAKEAEENISEGDEMMRRNQRVLMLQLGMKLKIRDSFKAHLEFALGCLRDVKKELDSLPHSTGKKMSMISIPNQIEDVKNKLAREQEPSTDEVTYDALERVLASKDLASTETDTGESEELTTKKLQRSKDGPIMTDEDDDDDD